MLRFQIMILSGLLILGLVSANARAETVDYDLEIARQVVSVTGKPARAMTINGSIPGPTLRFKEGDTARIRVHNRMDVETSIHWHGVLVPPDMDGVPNVSFPPIQAGTTFTYEFPIRQSGTYWYHSHTGLQEQSGVYGAIVIEPVKEPSRPDRDQVVVLSDWTDQDPHQVNRTLKRGSEWYAVEKGSAQSILGAARLGMLGDYLRRELQRMPAMDMADVAYDRFLANGKAQSVLAARPGEMVRLRIIDGSATTYFHLEFSGGPMTIVAADGQDVEPIQEQRFLIGVAETYDVLVRVPADGAYELRATAHDGSGYASLWIGSGRHHPAPAVPRPNLYHTMGRPGLQQILSLTPDGTIGMTDAAVAAGAFDRPGMAGMGSRDMGSMKMPTSMGKKADTAMRMDESMPGSAADAGESAGGAPAGSAPAPNARYGKRYGKNFEILAADVSSSGRLAVDGMDPSRPGTPYAGLRSTHRTAFPKAQPVREIRLTLDGDMERYVWLLNHRPLSESDSIRIRRGEVARFILINRTMMHHPMHLHGHFFRVINGQGDHAPLKHTVDVAPMSTTVIEFNANEFGDWFFHCHLLYHMKAGMARVVHYEGFALSPQLAGVRPDLYRDAWYAWGRADGMSHMTQGFLNFSNTRNILTAEWEVGWQNVDQTEWETLYTWDRYVNRFLSVFAGADLLGASSVLADARAVFGFRYRLPLNLESRAWVDSDGGTRFNLGKSFALTPRLALFGEAQYDTHDLWEGRVALSYLVQQYLSLIVQWHSDYGFGGGLRILF